MTCAIHNRHRACICHFLPSKVFRIFRYILLYFKTVFQTGKRERRGFLTRSPSLYVALHVSYHRNFLIVTVLPIHTGDLLASLSSCFHYGHRWLPSSFGLWWGYVSTDISQFLGACHGLFTLFLHLYRHPVMVESFLDFISGPSVSPFIFFLPLPAFDSHSPTWSYIPYVVPWINSISLSSHRWVSSPPFLYKVSWPS